MCKCLKTLCCPDFKFECNKKCCRSIPIKRYFLPLFGIVGITFIEEARTYIYFPIYISFAFFILFWNFPKVIYATATRPVYYEDMFIDEKKLPNYEVRESIKAKFKSIYSWVLIVTNSILAGALAEYWLFQSQNANTYVEVIGMSGGIIKIFQIVNNNIGKFMIKILKRFIKQESLQIKRKERKSIENILPLKRVNLSTDEISKLEENSKKSDDSGEKKLSHSSSDNQIEMSQFDFKNRDRADTF